MHGVTPRILANSSDIVARVFFYLEFARYLGHALLLSPAKCRWLDLIGETMKQTLHEKMVRDTDKKMFDRIFVDCSVPTSPVAELILYKACMERMPLVSAALEIRESREATDYRRLLSELRDAETMGVRYDALQVQTKLAKLDKIVQQWREEGDPSLGIVYERKVFDVKGIPKIGWLLALAGMNKIEVDDMLLNEPPGYLAFISSWYAKRH